MGSNLFLLILVVFFIGAMWLMSRNAKKRQREQQSFRDSLAPGQTVRTIGGVIGDIVDVEGDVITLVTTPDNEIRFTRTAISQVLEDDDLARLEGRELDEDVDYEADDDSEGDAVENSAPTGPAEDDVIMLNGEEVKRDDTEPK